MSCDHTGNRTAVKVSKKMLEKFHRIYEQIYENPFVDQRKITKNTGIARSTVSRYIEEMYNQSILLGPMVFLKPAENYLMYAAFCEFQDPYTVYTKLEGFPRVISRSLNFGKWNIMMVSDTQVDFTLLKGFYKCIYQGPKSVTYLSRVNFLDWNISMETIQGALTSPKEKTTLYEMGPPLPWDNKDWVLYEELKQNARIPVVSLLKKHSTSFERYHEWIQKIPHFASIHPAFYPCSLPNYLCHDFLFSSDYHHQLTHILGMLPSTGVFLSVGGHLFARLTALTAGELRELFSLMVKLRELNYFTSFQGATIIATPEDHNKRDPKGEEAT